jgi:gliding motility-associated-like protein
VQFFNNHTTIYPKLSANSLCKKVFLVTVLYLISFVASAQLKAKFGATPDSGCAPLIVQFHDSSTGNPISWQWDLGGSVSALQNPSATYFNPGTFTIKLIVTNAAGIKDTLVKQQYIKVFAQPTVNFIATPRTGCFPLPVCFTDNSTAGAGSITNWLWDFGDGTSSILQNPCHTYTSSGNYNVSLKVTNSNGCIKTKTQINYININTGVHAVFTNSSPTGCTVPETINFQNQSTGTGLLTYQWTFGDGPSIITTTSPSHTYTTAGVYTVQLIVTNTSGCKDTVRHTDSIVVGLVNTNFTMPSTVCVGSTFSLTNTSAPTPVSAIWRFDDNTTSNTINTTHSFATPGIHSVKLISNFGACLDSIVHIINVLPKPSTAFTGDVLVACKPPLTVNFNNTTTGAVSYEWHFGDGGTSTLQNPTYTYNATGFFTDTLITTNANGCKDTLIKTDYIKIKAPTVTINNLPQQGCAPLAWTFSSTPNSVVSIIGYEWFSNGVLFSTSSNPSHIFPVGEYDIKLVVTTVGGCTDTVIVPKGIKAALKPVPLFTATPRVVCAFNQVCFTDLSTGTIDFHDWDFGDGNHSSLENPCHIYEDTGLFTITLIVGNNGCRDTLTLLDYINVTPPIAKFNVIKNCNQHYIRTFDNISIGADTWTWNFGDGTPTESTIFSPVHTYGAVGTYIVTLTVHNNITGCDHFTTTTVVIAEEYAFFTASSLELCKNTPTVFTATSMHAIPDIASYDWDYGDLTPHGTAAISSHTYTQAGTFTCTLIITDVNGCKDTLVKNNYIKVNGPTANFIPSVPGSCLNAGINFTDQSVGDGTHPITEWQWNYGDLISETLTSPPFSHTYNSTGIFGVTLIIKDSYGCIDSIVKQNILTISKPRADFFTLDTISCPNKPILFGNSSTGPGLVYDWNFGDGPTIYHGATPTHFYVNQGIYTVHLTVTDIYGCVHDTTKTAYVIIKDPVADFTVSDSVSTCPPLIVQFTNNSLYYQSHVWDFGDGTFSTSLNPSHFYNTAGTFIAKLTVSSIGGCVSVKTKTIVVRGPQGSFSYSPIIGCKPLLVNFVATTIDNVSFVYDFGDGDVIASNDSIISHIYTDLGEFIPKIILKDAGGCTVPITGLDTIKVKGINAKFDRDTLLRCNSGSVIFTNQSNANEFITGYEWNFGDAAGIFTSTEVSPTHFYATTGLYYPTLVAHSENGCTDTLVSSVPIKVVKTPEIFIIQSANKCVPASMSFQGVLLNGDTSLIDWKWKFSNGVLVNTQNINAQFFNTAGIFSDTLYAKNSSGCRDTAYSTHEVYPKPVINAGNDITICQGTGQILTASGGQGYSWSPSTGLNTTIGNTVTAMPDSVTNYTVTGTSSFGCVNTDVVKVDVRHPFTMDPGINRTVCEGSATTFTATGAVQYSWSPSIGLNTTIGATVIATPPTTTDYVVTGKDDKNCFSDTANFKVKVYPIPTVNAGPDKTINVGQSITLTPTTTGGVTNVVWTPNTWITSINSPSITVKPNLDQKYKVTVTNAGGCIASSTVNVFVLCDGANVFIPNTFSPNADGANDIFFPRGTGLYTIKQLRIFNRWGEEVFTRSNFNANDEKAGWDGTFKGQKLTPDVYIYIMDIQCQNNSVLVYKGNIALIK